MTFYKKNSLTFRLLIPINGLIICLFLIFAIAIFAIFYQFALSQINENKHYIEEEIFNILNQAYKELDDSGKASVPTAVFMQRAKSTAVIETFSRSRIAHVQISEGGDLIYEIDNNPHPDNNSTTEHPFFERLLLPFFHFDYSGSLLFKPWDWQVTFVMDDSIYHELMQKAMYLFVIIAILFLITNVILMVMMEKIIAKPLRNIIIPVKQGKIPDYKGTFEFEFLSNTISDYIKGRIQFEKELKDQKNFLKHIFDAVEHPFFVINVDDLTMVMGNKMVYNKKNELFGITCHELVYGNSTPCDDKSRMCPVKLIKETGNPCTVEHTCYDEEGQKKYLKIHGYPLFDNVGNVEKVVEYIEDITDMKESQEALEVAKNDALAASKAKSDFLANMSHEIRSPMNAIIGMTHLALQTDLDHKQRNYIEKTHRSAESLLGILNDILDLSKIESGKLDMEMIDFHLEDVIDSLANLVALKAEEKDLELIFDVDIDVPRALIGDPLRLSQILVNLTNNAVKFTEANGEILITVEVDEEDEETAVLHFSVCDTGIGITQEQKSKLFKSFSQADNSTTRKYGGSGLGLVISKNLTEIMGGDIWVESEASFGSTFHFTIPFKKQQGKSLQLRNMAAKLGALKVLVVDDNATSRTILSEMLESFGFRVDRVESGKAAIELLEQSVEQTSYDLILMDWRMPGMDGFESIREIQNCNNIRKVPAIIIVTAYGCKEIQDVQKDVKLAGVLNKPVTPFALFDVVMCAMGIEVATQSWDSNRNNEVLDAINKLRGAKVLLVEDNEINQEVALELLRSNGISVDVANNGAEALDMLEQKSFDGVLMDCQMPVMDGYTATTKIREKQLFKELPIIAMTANAMVNDQDKVLQFGMNDHIAKPINFHDMFLTLAKWLTVGSSVSFRETSSMEVSSTVDGLPDLPGIDTEAGIAIFGGNIPLYRKILLMFSENQRDFEQQFLAAQTDQDQNAAIRAAHTLKGVSSNIGAIKVQKAALALEKACKEGRGNIDNLLAAVTSELQTVIKGLEALKSSPHS